MSDYSRAILLTALKVLETERSHVLDVLAADLGRVSDSEARLAEIGGLIHNLETTLTKEKV